MHNNIVGYNSTCNNGYAKDIFEHHDDVIETRGSPLSLVLSISFRSMEFMNSKFCVEARS